MKNIFFLFLLITGMVEAQIVNIPDANFKAKLLAADTNNTIAHAIGGGYMRVDFNNDGEIQLSEATFIDSLDVNNANIADLSGISSFNNLKGLKCANNQISALNLNSLTDLEDLWCGSNNLPSLDLNGLVNLKSVSCYGNNLSNIDLSGLPNLKFLEVGDNLLTNLNLSPVLNLEEFRCISNQITSLDLSALVNLKRLECGFNQLTSLDLTGLTSLELVRCDNNLLSTLDVSQQISLIELSCRLNNLNALFIKNGTGNGSQLYFDGNPNIEFICADEAELSFVQILLTSYGYSNCVVNTYCTFTPGGNYNTISGSLTFDNNQDGCDAADLKPKNLRIDVNDGSNVSTVFTNVSGIYTTYTQEGSFDITPIVDNAAWFNFSPATAMVNFADNNNNITTQDFCITANGVHLDIEVVISPIFFARPGFDATYQITYRNEGNQTVSGAVNLIFDDSKTDFVSANPSVDNLAVNSLSWNYSNLLPFESRTITVVFNVNGSMEIPAVNIGDILTFQATISPLDSDENLQDNSFTLEQTVVGSYDPNNIICLEGDVVPATEIGKYLHYAINFENTGTFPAENIVVKTEIDLTKFDIGSLQLMNTNFPVDARITGNKVEFIFENIQLSIGGHGHILLKIKTQNTLVTGDAVANRGDIFFDYNFPIDTGLANTVFQTLSNSVFEVDSSVSVYPNPAVNEVTITADNNIKSIQLYDAQGRIITTRLMDDLESKLDVSSYSKGIYFIKITTEKGAQVQKLLKD